MLVNELLILYSVMCSLAYMSLHFKYRAVVQRGILLFFGMGPCIMNTGLWSREQYFCSLAWVPELQIQGCGPESNNFVLWHGSLYYKYRAVVQRAMYIFKFYKQGRIYVRK